MISYTKRENLLTRIKKKQMKKNSPDFKYCINLAIDNAKERIKLLEKEDKNCVLEEYKEWINGDMNYHSILLLREDPMI